MMATAAPHDKGMQHLSLHAGPVLAAAKQNLTHLDPGLTHYGGALTRSESSELCSSMLKQ